MLRCEASAPTTERTTPLLTEKSHTINFQGQTSPMRIVAQYVKNMRGEHWEIRVMETKNFEVLAELKKPLKAFKTAKEAAEWAKTWTGY